MMQNVNPRTWLLLTPAAAFLASGVCAQQVKVPARPGTSTPTSVQAAPPSRPAGDPLADRASVHIPRPAKRVLALYYPWYGMPQRSGKWLHQDGVEADKKRMASHVHYPALGAYDSSDPATIEAHLRQAKEAGIDTLVCSWWGRQDPTDRAIRAVLKAAPEIGLTVSILWERIGGERTEDSATADLVYLLETFGKQTGYLREAGRPVFFALNGVCKAFSPEEWAGVLAEAGRRSAPGPLVIGEGGSQSDVLLWDGLNSLNYLLRIAGRSPVVCAETHHDLNRPSFLLARAAGRISVFALSPGCDDRKQNQRQGLKGGILVERQEGLVYKAVWEQALKDDPDWVLINSFNQWHAGTEIEPSAELGDQYLKLTREFTARFKARPTPVRR